MIINVIINYNNYHSFSIDKCLIPYYGGCPTSRECITSEFDVNCGNCLPGFFPAFPSLNCTGN